MEFDDERDMHAFAMTPIVDNDLIVHHIDLNACENEEAGMCKGDITLFCSGVSFFVK